MNKIGQGIGSISRRPGIGRGNSPSSLLAHNSSTHWCGAGTLVSRSQEKAVQHVTKREEEGACCWQVRHRHPEKTKLAPAWRGRVMTQGEPGTN